LACRNNITGITDTATTALNLKIPLMPSIPAVLLAVGARTRKGLNKKEIASRIISRFDEFGIPSGPNAAGGQNTMVALTVGIVETIIDSICYDAKVSTAIMPMEMMVQASGGNGGGPVVCVGGNTTFASMNGIVS
jgi:hypothetical protein